MTGKMHWLKLVISSTHVIAVTKDSMRCSNPRESLNE
jgi:hypothetical protein